ncbi:PadR family transcriptional regulator [Halorubrum ejinorense]|uniref:PadR family transcriptional regulator n=1 Tax=Halorubrum ejinorense TaxID=425309 RepID=A0AAV3SS36_9EURY
MIAGLDDPHGLAIKDELEEYYASEINPGQLYPNLDALIEKGLVEKSQKDGRTNEYALAHKGTREIEERTKWKSDYIEIDG